MACPKMCKQGRDDIIVKVNLHLIYTIYKALSLHLFTLQLQTNVKTIFYISNVFTCKSLIIYTTVLHI